jgi:hypothetical protein
MNIYTATGKDMYFSADEESSTLRVLEYLPSGVRLYF